MNRKEDKEEKRNKDIEQKENEQKDGRFKSVVS